MGPTKYKKVISMFAAGSYGPKLSKEMGGSIHHAASFVGLQLTEPEVPVGSWREIAVMNIQMDPPLGQLGRECVAKFTATCTVDWVQAFRACLVANAELVAAKSQELSIVLAANPKWGGCQSKLPLDCTLLDFPETFVTDFSKAGCEMWQSLLKLNVWRFNPSSVPLSGVASAVTPSDKQTLYLLCIPIESIIKEGISLKDVKNFLETPQGLKVETRTPHQEALK